MVVAAAVGGDGECAVGGGGDEAGEGVAGSAGGGGGHLGVAVLDGIGGCTAGIVSPADGGTGGCDTAHADCRRLGAGGEGERYIINASTWRIHTTVIKPHYQETIGASRQGD